MSSEDDISHASPNKVLFPTAKASIAALILGVLTIWPLRIFAAIPAVISGHLALREIKKSQGKMTGTGYARFGLFVGYVDISLVVIFAVIGLILLPILGSQVKSTFTTVLSSQASGK